MWEIVTKFFNEQSALANFLQIAGAFIAIALTIWRGAKWVQRHNEVNRHTTISKWIEGRQRCPGTAHQLRIAVVDDHPEDYPLDTLRRLGYSVTHIGHLNLAEVPSLLRYDCILLDINGVLDEDPKRGGLEVLKRLKVTNGPYIVAVSSRGFDITMSEFFMLADHRLRKPIPPAEVEGIIEGAFASRFSAEHAAHRIDEAVGFGNAHSRSTRKALHAAIGYIMADVPSDAARMALALVAPGERLQSTLTDLDVIRRSFSRRT